LRKGDVATSAVPSRRTVPAGHRLTVKIEVPTTSQENMPVAYDTTAYPASVSIP
jgi:hypothetical protein